MKERIRQHLALFIVIVSAFLVLVGGGIAGLVAATSGGHHPAPLPPSVTDTQDEQKDVKISNIRLVLDPSRNDPSMPGHNAVTITYDITTDPAANGKVAFVTIAVMQNGERVGTVYSQPGQLTTGVTHYSEPYGAIADEVGPLSGEITGQLVSVEFI